MVTTSSEPVVEEAVAVAGSVVEADGDELALVSADRNLLDIVSDLWSPRARGLAAASIATGACLLKVAESIIKEKYFKNYFKGKMTLR